MTKPTVDSIIKECNIRLHNGSWYVQENVLKSVLEKVIEKAYNTGKEDGLKQCSLIVNQSYGEGK